MNDIKSAALTIEQKCCKNDGTKRKREREHSRLFCACVRSCFHFRDCWFSFFFNTDMAHKYVIVRLFSKVVKKKASQLGFDGMPALKNGGGGRQNCENIIGLFKLRLLLVTEKEKNECYILLFWFSCTPPPFFRFRLLIAATLCNVLYSGNTRMTKLRGYSYRRTKELCNKTETPFSPPVTSSAVRRNLPRLFEKLFHSIAKRKKLVIK